MVSRAYPMNGRQIAALVVLLIALVVQTAASMQTKSITFDEKEFIVTGYYTLRTGQFYFNSGHPHLLQVIAGIPLLFLDVELPVVAEPPVRLDFPVQLGYTQQFFDLNAAQIDQIVFASRLAMVVLSVILAGFVFQTSRELFGINSGLFAVFLYVLNPNVLAHSGLSTLDIGFTALIFIHIFFLRKLVNQPRPRYVILAGITLGLCFLSKVNAPILLGIYGLYGLAAIIKGTPALPLPIIQRLRSARAQTGISLILAGAGILLVTAVVINVGYGFDHTFQPLNNYLDLLGQRRAEFASEEKSERDERIRNLLAPVSGVPIPLPNWYVQVTAFQFLHNSGGHRTFLLGEPNDSGVGLWYYHLVAFLLKMPVAFFGLLIGWGIYVATRPRGQRLSWNELLLLIPAAYLFVIVSMGNIKLGFRHILPVLPFLFVLISRLATVQIRWARIGLAVLSLGYAVSSLLAYPHYLAYFNEFVGGSQNGYKYLVDSNLDWGQELKNLRQYIQDHDLQDVKFYYYGGVSPTVYDVGTIELPLPTTSDETCDPVQGNVAISVSLLQFYPKCFGWLNTYEPVARLGHSLFIYHIPPV